MIKNVYWRTNLYFLVITDDANRSWCMEIHVDQINCSQDQIVMQSSIQCRTFEFLKAVEKNTCTLQFLGKSCNAKHALLRHFICTLHQVNLFHKTFSVLLHVFQTFNRLGDRFLSCCEIFLPTYWNVFSSKSDTSEQSNTWCIGIQNSRARCKTPFNYCNDTVWKTILRMLTRYLALGTLLLTPRTGVCFDVCMFNGQRALHYSPLLSFV